MIVVVMGVSGSGKTTVGTLLATAMHCAFLEGDLLHSAGNLAKMKRGIPLNDADRMPWLAAVRTALVEAHRDGRDLVAGCSALKESYRSYLEEGVPVRWVYLTGDPALIRSRLGARRGHFMDPDLLDSQLATLDVPSDALQVDVADAPEAIVRRIFRALTTEPEIRISPDADLSFGLAAGFLADFIRQTVAARGDCLLALSGGETPRGLYRLLGYTERYPIPWEAVQVFWCDERYVPGDDPRSNYGMVRETLLDHIPCRPENIHPMPTHFPDPSDAAAAYEERLREHVRPNGPGLDLVLLGLGADGHTASLFAGSPALHEEDAWVLPVRAPADPPSRLTLTLPLLKRSGCAAFLVTGQDKAAAVARVLAAPERAEEPVGAILRADARVIWWLDQQAAAALPHPPSN